MKSIQLNTCLLFLLLGCTSKPIEDLKSHSLQGQIALIFEHSNTPETVRERNDISEIYYVDNDGIHRKEEINREVNDTVVIKTNRKMIEVQHQYKDIDKLSYLFTNGDTIHFSYEGFKPIASGPSKDSHNYDLNYDLLKRSVVCGDSFPSYIMLKNFTYFLNFNTKGLEAETYRIFEKVKQKSRKEFLHENILLDSLRHAKIISFQYYNFFKRKLLLEKTKSDLDDPNFYLIKHPLNDTLATRSVQITLENHEDTFLEFIFYQGIVEWLYQIESRKVKRIVSSNGNIPEYKALYDSLKNNKLYPPSLRKSLMLKGIEDIIRSSGVEDIYKYRKQFDNDISDSSYVKYLTDKYKIEGEITTKLRLTKSNKQKIDFDDLLKASHGKVIYVDIWASWCGPCIKALPLAHKLEEEFKNKDVVFLYISKDESFSRWAKAEEKYNLNKSFSYLIENPYSSKFLEDLRIQGIPHYLLYNTNGKLVHQNAPDPGSSEIRNFIVSYLKEDPDK